MYVFYSTTSTETREKRTEKQLQFATDNNAAAKVGPFDSIAAMKRSLEDEAVRRLVAMGFPEHRIRPALEATQYNEEMVLDLLLADENHPLTSSNASSSVQGPRKTANPYIRSKAATEPATAAAAAVSSNPASQQQRTWGAQPATLRTMGPQYQYDTNTSDKPHKVQHIPTLSQADTAKAILERIKTEFEPIIRRRKYNVTSITEMCCCSDGLDHLSNTSSTRRKTKIMPDNVLGYNLTAGYRQRPAASASDKPATATTSNSTHRIHLRLRHPPSAGSWEHHILYDYEHIAGTMCHELAHCVYGDHDQHFYKLMDEIMEEHSLLLVRGVASSSSSKASDKNENHWSGTGYTLGGGTKGAPSSKRVTNNNNITSPTSKRNVLAQAALGRFQDRPHSAATTGKLNEDGPTSSLQNFLTPREAAAIAAESRWIERQRIDSQFCLPCQEIIEILDEEEESEEEDEEEGKKEKASIVLVHSKDGNDIIEILDD